MYAIVFVVKTIFIVVFQASFHQSAIYCTHSKKTYVFFAINHLRLCKYVKYFYIGILPVLLKRMKLVYDYLLWPIKKIAHTGIGGVTEKHDDYFVKASNLMSVLAIIASLLFWWLPSSVGLVASPRAMQALVLSSTVLVLSLGMVLVFNYLHRYEHTKHGIICAAVLLSCQLLLTRGEQTGVCFMFVAAFVSSSALFKFKVAYKYFIGIPLVAVCAMYLAGQRPPIISSAPQILFYMRFFHFGLCLTAIFGVLYVFRLKNKAYHDGLHRAYEALHSTNMALEEAVQHRTAVLRTQNQQLSDYAHLNAHGLRAPLATLQGLAHLWQIGGIAPHEQAWLIDQILAEANKLDSISRDMQRKLEVIEKKRPPQTGEGVINKG